MAKKHPTVLVCRPVNSHPHAQRHTRARSGRSKHTQASPPTVFCSGLDTYSPAPFSPDNKKTKPKKKKKNHDERPTGSPCIVLSVHTPPQWPKLYWPYHMPRMSEPIMSPYTRILPKRASRLERSSHRPRTWTRRVWLLRYVPHQVLRVVAQAVHGGVAATVDRRDQGHGARSPPNRDEKDSTKGGPLQQSRSDTPPSPGIRSEKNTRQDETARTKNRNIT